MEGETDRKEDVHVYAVRIPGEVGRTELQSGDPRAHVAHQSHEPGRRVFESQRAADGEAGHVLKMSQLRPPTVAELQACAQPPAAWIPVCPPVDGAAARDG